MDFMAWQDMVFYAATLGHLALVKKCITKTKIAHPDFLQSLLAT